MADPAPVEPEPTPQPVMTTEWWKSTVLSLTLAAVAVVTAFGGWHPTDEQITAITTAGAVLVAVVFPLIAYFVHNRVTPVVVAERAVAAAKTEGYNTAVVQVAALADVDIDAPEAPRVAASDDQGTVRSVHEVDQGYLTAVRWDDGTIGEHLFSVAHPEGTRVSR